MNSHYLFSRFLPLLTLWAQGTPTAILEVDNKPPDAQVVVRAPSFSPPRTTFITPPVNVVLPEGMPEGSSYVGVSYLGYSDNSTSVFVGPKTEEAIVVVTPEASGNVSLVVPGYQDNSAPFRPATVPPADVVQDLPVIRAHIRLLDTVYGRGVRVVNGVFLGDDEPLPQGQIRAVSGRSAYSGTARSFGIQVPENIVGPNPEANGSVNVPRAGYINNAAPFRPAVYPPADVVQQIPVPGALIRLVFPEYGRGVRVINGVFLGDNEPLPQGQRATTRGRYPDPGRSFIGKLQLEQSSIGPKPEASGSVVVTQSGYINNTPTVVVGQIPPAEIQPMPQGRGAQYLGRYPETYKSYKGVTATTPARRIATIDIELDLSINRTVSLAADINRTVDDDHLINRTASGTFKLTDL
jgi:hypothetical protein